jgi:ABC-type nitrate/sulfonate/bicarbonate transport system permease component
LPLGFFLYLCRKLKLIMKLKKRKIKYAAIFFICWFVLLVFLVDGVLKFQTLVDYFGSYALVEVTLLLLVILPTLAVYIFTKEK